VADPQILEFASFRCHILIPHEVVTGIKGGVPVDRVLTEAGGTFRREGREVLRVNRDGVTTTVTALTEIYVQEPGLSVKIAGDGAWRGLGRNAEWTSPWYTLEQKDAHKSTVHFSRIRTSKTFTTGVEYRAGDDTKTQSLCRWRFRSDGGFTKLLNAPEHLPSLIPWTGAEVAGRGYTLAGTVPRTDEVLRRWELAGWPDFDWMHFLGWTGGAAAVTDIHGSDVGAPGDKYLWQPRSWRRMRPGQSISQTLTMRKL
jgi:hypothetical protein